MLQKFLDKKIGLDKSAYGIFGLGCNILGTLISILSIKETDGFNVGSVNTGIFHPLTMIDPTIAKVGLLIIIVGFGFQLLEKSKKTNSITLIELVNLGSACLALYFLMQFFSNWLFFV